jgi:hypothetical protein
MFAAAFVTRLNEQLDADACMLFPMQVQGHCCISPLLLLSEDPAFPAAAAPVLHCLVQPISQALKSCSWPAVQKLLIIAHRSLAESADSHVMLLPDVTALCNALLQVFPSGPKELQGTPLCSPAADVCEAMALSAACIFRLLRSTCSASSVWMSQNVYVISCLLKSFRHINPDSLRATVSCMPEVPATASSAAAVALQMLHVHSCSLRAAAHSWCTAATLPSGLDCEAEVPEAVSLQLLHLLFEAADILCFPAEIDEAPSELEPPKLNAPCTSALAAAAVDLLFDAAQQSQLQANPGSSGQVALLTPIPCSQISHILHRWLQLGAIPATCR